MISHDEKFIFIHIPKTSGNSLSLFLKDCVSNPIIRRSSIMGQGQGISVLCEKIKRDIKHESLDYYLAIYGKDIVKNYFSFTIVRNPYDRILSWYFFTRRSDKNSTMKFNKQDFIKFITKDIISPGQPLSHQYQYVTFDNKIIIDKIVKYESLIEDLNEIECLKRYDFDNYPCLNSSMNSKIDYNDYYDDELKEMVYNMFEKDFQIFGYSKN